MEENGFDQLAKDVLKYLDDVYPDKNKTFKVVSRRARKNFPKNSQEINADLGEIILDTYPEMKVDVHHPDIMLNVEIRSQVNIYSMIIPGPGGMPVGTAGKAMLLLSGGIDSPVARLYDRETWGLPLKQLISMHRLIPVSVQNRK